MSRNKIERKEKRISKLNKEITLLKKYKIKFEKNLNILHKEYKNKKINKIEYREILSDYLENKSIEEHIKEYNDQIKERKIILNKIIEKNQNESLDYKKIITILAITVLLGLMINTINPSGFAVLEDSTLEIQSILTDCGTLNTANSKYTLTGDISADGTCITIGANNITIDGQGHTITYALLSNGHAIYNSGHNDLKVINTLIKDGPAATSTGYHIDYINAKRCEFINNTINSSHTNGTSVLVWSGISDSFIENNTIEIENNPAGHVLYIYSNSNNNTIKNNYVGNIYNYVLLITSSSYYNVVENNRFNGTKGGGIYLGSGDNNFTNNLIITNGKGIQILSSNNTIKENNIETYGTSNSGMYVTAGDNLSIFDNLIHNYNSSSYGIYILSGGSKYSNFENNNITLDGTSSTGFRITPTTPNNNLTLKNNVINITNNGIGITISNTENSTFSSNTFFAIANTGGTLSSGFNYNEINNNEISSNGYYALNINSIMNNTIYNNTIKSNNKDVIYMIASQNNRLENNSISSYNGDNYGFYLSGSNYNIIKGNVINNSGTNIEGVYTYNSINNLFENNKIDSPGGHNIYFNGNCSNTKIKNNILKYNGKEDIYFNYDASNIEFIDQNTQSYRFNGVLTNTIIENTSGGKIHLLEDVPVSTGNLTDEVEISFNKAYIKSTSDFNKVANITLYNISELNFIDPKIFKDGVECNTCYNFTALNKSIVKFNVTSFSKYNISEVPTEVPPVLISPGNDSIIFDRYPTFIWNSSLQSLGDVYQLQADNDSDFSSPILNVTNIAKTGNETNYTSTTIFPIDETYYWKVRKENLSYSEINQFDLSSLINVTILNNEVIFGASNVRGNSDNTTDNNPSAPVVRNEGNYLINVSINATPLFTSEIAPNEYYQYKVSDNETNSIDLINSIITITNMPTTTPDNSIVNLNWIDSNDEARVDLYFTTPIDEPPGNKTSSIIFQVS